MNSPFYPMRGPAYTEVLASLIKILSPATYFEIGTQTGLTLSIPTCPSMAVDPRFVINQNVVGSKESLHLFQSTSDSFFRDHSPSDIFRAPIDFAFLDGMHLFEFVLRDFLNTERHSKTNSVIALHDCIPADVPMTRRTESDPVRMQSTQPDWWTGDVWKVVPILRKFRPELRITVIDSFPTGLALVTNLSPGSRVLQDHYFEIVEEYSATAADPATVQEIQSSLGIQVASDFLRPEIVRRHFWL